MRLAWRSFCYPFIFIIKALAVHSTRLQGLQRRRVSSFSCSSFWNWGARPMMLAPHITHLFVCEYTIDSNFNYFFHPKTVFHSVAGFCKSAFDLLRVHWHWVVYSSTFIFLVLRRMLLTHLLAHSSFTCTFDSIDDSHSLAVRCTHFFTIHSSRYDHFNDLLTLVYTLPVSGDFWFECVGMSCAIHIACLVKIEWNEINILHVEVFDVWVNCMLLAAWLHDVLCYNEWFTVRQGHLCAGWFPCLKHGIALSLLPYPSIDINLTVGSIILPPPPSIAPPPSSTLTNNGINLPNDISHRMPAYTVVRILHLVFATCLHVCMSDRPTTTSSGTR